MRDTKLLPWTEPRVRLGHHGALFRLGSVIVLCWSCQTARDDDPDVWASSIATKGADADTSGESSEMGGGSLLETAGDASMESTGAIGDTGDASMTGNPSTTGDPSTGDPTGGDVPANIPYCEGVANWDPSAVAKEEQQLARTS